VNRLNTLGSAAIAASLAGLACNADAMLGRASFALEGEATFFRLRIFEAPPEADLSGKAIFDTGCIAQQSRTYELSNIPVGQGYAVVYEGFPAKGCAPTERISLGYRGEVTITEQDQPYFHVQAYPEGGLASLPEGLNLSAAAATSIETCEADADCPGPRDICYDDAAPTFWCVPSCAADTDCAAVHPRATCDLETGWCMLNSPYPLNLSEARAFGRAETLDNGDVVFFGGLRQDVAGSDLIATVHSLERFDARTGLFAAVDVTGEAPSTGGFFGFTALGGDRFVAVGGLRQATMRATSEGGVELDANWAQDLSSDVIVWDLSRAKVGVGTLPRGLARSAVVPLPEGRFVVAGGLVSSGLGVEATRSTLVCDIDDALGVACVEGPLLQHTRQAPAATCLDEGCAKLLIIGGNQGGKLAEVLDLETGKSDAFSVAAFGDKLFEPILCGLDLVAGSRSLDAPSPVTAVRFSVSPSGVDANPLAGAPQTSMFAAIAGASAAFAADRTCTIAGGLLDLGMTSRVVAVGGGGFLPYQATLAMPRFGALAARIGAGVLEGRVIFGGGLALPIEDGVVVAGPVDVVRGVEVLSPRGGTP
jgi:hypothetical protein